ncbi:MAG: DUF1292 domain-containing protein [Clostridia bacterium]|nr:DUF1292 domain-containing protein [Clostridia bacterium]
MTEKSKKDIDKECDCCCCGDKDCDCEDNDCDIVELVDDEGKVIKFIHVATIDYKDNWYVFFSPTEEVDGINTDEVVIFHLLSDDEGKDVFEPIEDEKLLEEVYNEYINTLDDDEEGCEE